ncbi:DNA-binding domain-containing protein [Epibacterium ulvae]|uniref:HvfC/BufC N-terminal domain-containing protein n=1 Tax=Epibacterium ulvae TaxID=1156985 RepID=UPI001BFC110E|nr:DNA-binding domain-containing protein [Epibacterium ulvae]MBT8152955.1 DNA-binding domain-containing protein [Epibacterium ulvae]
MTTDTSPANAVNQAAFTRAMMDASITTPQGLRDSQNRPAGRRFNVYRNNVAVSLTDALLQAFPVVTKLLSEENMKGLAGIFLRAHPPQSPLMMFYGAEFPDFIAQMEQLSHLGYLADVARLEQHMRRAYHAADATPIDPDALGSIAPEDLMQTRVSFTPAMQVIRSPWPIFDIWRFNMEQDAPKPQAGAQDVLITRPEFDPTPQLLPVGGAAWITALTGGKTIGEAFEVANQDADNFDLSTTLALLLQGNTLTALHRKD